METNGSTSSRLLRLVLDLYCESYSFGCKIYNNTSIGSLKWLNSIRTWHMICIWLGKEKVESVFLFLLVLAELNVQFERGERTPITLLRCFWKIKGTMMHYECRHPQNYVLLGFASSFINLYSSIISALEHCFIARYVNCKWNGQVSAHNKI